MNERMIDTTVREYKVCICQACIDGIGDECHTPGCVFFLHRVDLPLMKELLIPVEPVKTEAIESFLDERCAKCGFSGTTDRCNSGCPVFNSKAELAEIRRKI